MKRKLFFIIALACCLVLAVGILAACNDSSQQTGGNDPSGQPGDDAVYRTVTFDLNGGDGEIEPRDYAVGYLMDLPEPTRSGYRFIGWQDAFGEKFDSTSIMPNEDLTLYAQWEIIVSSYEDEYVYFKPATQGVKDPDTKNEYNKVSGYVYVELTSDDLGGREHVGEDNNFDFVSGVSMEYSVKDGYTLQWWRDYDCSIANGAQRFTLNYGSNFQFLTVNTNQQTVATYLVDFYVLHDYAVNLYSNIYAEEPYDTVYVVENRTFASDTEAYQLRDFEFDKRVYWNENVGWGEWTDFNYSTRITRDWDLYQTYKPKTITADLDGGTLDAELTVKPYTEYQQLPVPAKEGYDFIGWQLPGADNNKEDYFADITGFNATQLLGAGGGVNGDVYFDTLKAVWLPEQYHKTTDGDTVSFSRTVPVVTYTDDSLTEINEIRYVVYGTDCIVPNRIVYNGAFEFLGWYSYKQDADDTDGSVSASRFDFNIEVTEPVSIYQNMRSLYDGTRLTALGLYLNGTRTFDSIGTGQRIKAYLPAKGEYTFRVSTDNYINISYGSEGYYATSSSQQTITITNDSAYGREVFFDVASYDDTFRISFSGAAGATDGSPVYVSTSDLYAIGDEVSAPDNPGCTFLGWYDANDVKISEEGSFAFVLSTFDADAVYTARWQECATTLTVNDENAGSVSGLEGTTVVGGEVTVTAETNPGYTFIGWYDGDTKVSAEGSYDFTFTMTAEAKVYTAKWIKVSVVSEDTSKGTVSELTEEYLLGDKVSVTATTKAGYTFIGWYNGDEKVADTLTYEFTMPAEAVTYTAKWIKVRVVSEDTSKGMVSELTEEYLLGDKVSVTATPNLGYTFIGWYNDDEKLADTLTYKFAMPAENVTYTAKWTLNAGMEQFTFTSSPTSLTITGVTDGSVTSLVVPSYVTTINRGAFSNCKSLESITIPFVGATNTSSNSFGYIFGSSSYYYNSDYVPTTLKYVIITGGTSINNYAFYECNRLTSVTIPDSVTSIGEKAFRDCSGLTSVTIPDSVTSIGDFAFYNCDSLTSVTIPDSATSIGHQAFSYCDGLTSVTIGNGVMSIGRYAFSGCSSLTSVTIGNGVTSIVGGAFLDCTSLTSITIPDSVTSIGGGAFNGCTGLTSIIIPDSVTSIGDSAFYNCDSLTSVTIPNSVTSIGYYAFAYCDGLTSVTFEGTVAEWNAIERHVYWGNNSPFTEVVCSDGTV